MMAQTKRVIFVQPKTLIKTMVALFIAIIFFSLGKTVGFVFLAGILGMKQIQLVKIIRTAYQLYRAGRSVRTAISIATGGWGLAINLLVSAGLAWLAHNLNSWYIGY